MDKVLISHGSLRMVPMKKRHIIPLYSTMSVENLFETEAVYKIDLMKTLIEQADTPDVFIVENNKEPLAIVGVQGITHQKGLMWSMFSENMKDNWFSFVKASPKLIDFLHTHYHEIVVDTWEGNHKMLQWLGWLGFELTEMYTNDNGFNMAHFVRCNEHRKNVYAFPSRPVIH
tara:strand:- start:8821 stop:9339 length:519 start_codon:yes stop_codon:yes gene_type:complete